MSNYEIGNHIALWTDDNPPLFAGIFSVVDPGEFVSDLVLTTAYNEYLFKSLLNPTGWYLRDGLRFQLNHTLSDKYNPDTALRSTYQPTDIIPPQPIPSYIEKPLVFICFKQFS